MISIFATSLVVIVLLLALMQTVLVIKYRWFLKGVPTFNSDDGGLPNAAIILCLRGQDEGIPDCLAELMGQDYPEFELHIAFDSRNDSAVAQVEEFFKDRSSHARLHFFDPRPDCSFKCSGIVHVLNELNETFDVIAFCDGDAIVDNHWLKDLVSPMMSDSKIGATTGNRWFAPSEPTTGALVRKHWNAAAIVQMQAYDIAWGGSMAVQRNAIDDCGLIEIWAKSFCEDTALTAALATKGLQLHRVPNLIVENDESATTKDCFHWIARQLTTVRLHHPGWPLVLAHGVITGVATLVAPVVAITFLALGFQFAGRSILLAWLLYQGINIVLLMLIEQGNRSALAGRESFASYNPVPEPSIWLRIWSLAMVQIMHPMAVVKAMLMTTVEWRGVTYRLKGGRISVATRP